MKKTVFTRCLALMLGFVMALSCSTAIVFADGLVGTGEKDDPYVITTAEQLKALSSFNEVGYVSLGDNIDMSGTEASVSFIKKLTGAFMGYGYSISNLKLKGGTGTYSESVNTGIIGEVSGNVEIRDVILNNVTVSEGISSNNNVGILVGKVSAGSNAEINNCIINGCISSTSSVSANIGAIVGCANGTIDDKTMLTVENTVSNVPISAASSNYAGAILGVSQYYTMLNVKNCAILGDISGSARYACGIVSWVNSSSSALNISNSYVGAKLKGSKQYGVCYATMSFSVQSSNFYYDTEKNPSPSSWDKFELCNKSGVGGEGKTTSEIKQLSLFGFEVRNGEFNNMLVPAWNPTEPPEPPVKLYSCTVKFEGTEDGTVKVFKDGKEIETSNGEFVLSEKGEYTYEIKNLSEYLDVTDGAFSVGDDDDKTTKTIWVHLDYKTVELTGQGTEESPYEIKNGAELFSLAALVNNGDAAQAHVVLTADITVKSSWTPLGKNTVYAFGGVFDGNGHSVTVTVDNPNLSYFGFFGCLSDGAVVKNLTVNGEIYCSEPYAFVGGISARARGNVTIENCVNNASVSSLARGNAGTGGIVGGYDDSVEYVTENIRLTVKNTKNNGLVMVSGTEREAFVGGIVGSNANCVQLEGCESNGDVYAPGCTAGGLLGHSGYQTGEYKPFVSSCKVTGAVIGLSDRTGHLYGKGTILPENIVESGNNTAETALVTNKLIAEASKYRNAFSANENTEVNTYFELLCADETADSNIKVAVSQGEKDVSKGFVLCDENGMKLAKLNETGRVIEETATIRLESDKGSIRKPVTVSVYPSKSKSTSLMNKIAAGYAGKSDEWIVFDMAVYEKLGFGENSTDKEHYKNVTVNKLSTNLPLVLDRAKGEIILSILGVDTDRLTAFGGTSSYSNAEKMQKMDFGTSYYTAPWVLLAEEAGKLKLTDEQRNAMISCIVSGQGENGLFYSVWGGERYEDVDTTGTALAALSRFYSIDEKAKAFIDKAVEGLSDYQGENGSFGNINSDAMVICGLAAVGINPSTDVRFTKNGGNLGSALMLYVNSGESGFEYIYQDGTAGEEASALATEQGFRALVVLKQLEKCIGFNVYSLAVTGGEKINNVVTDFTATEDTFEKDETGEGDSESGEEAGNGSGSSSSKISVSVTVKALGKKWISKRLSVKSGTTVADVLKEAFAAEGITAEGIDSGYITAVTMDSVTLKYGDKGENSGWMYKVDGKSPNVGISDYKLSSVSEVLLYYTEDWTKEEESNEWVGGTGGTVSSSGGSTSKDENKSDEETPDNTVEEKTMSFTDVDGEAWYYEYVKAAFEKELISGVSETEFAPNDYLTRAMFITLLYRLEGEPKAGNADFADVDGEAWYASAVSWGYENGIISGVNETEFAPNENITREQMAAIIERYAEFKGKDVSAEADLTVFEDLSEVSDYALSAFKFTVSNEILVGKSDSTLSPCDTATRAEAAAVLVRIMEFFEA